MEAEEAPREEKVITGHAAEWSWDIKTRSGVGSEEAFVPLARTGSAKDEKGKRPKEGFRRETGTIPGIKKGNSACG